MKTSTLADFVITPQPDESTCGAASLHSVYRFWGDDGPLEAVIEQLEHLSEGGTLAVMMALHALDRGYEATIYTCNLHLFDPTWFAPGAPPLRGRLLAQRAAKSDPKLRAATDAYLRFLGAGGRLYMEDITLGLIAGLLGEGLPIIVGLSATWLYRAARERPDDMVPDDAAGEPTGHFVVVHGADVEARRVSIADPYLHEPFPGSHRYAIDANRLIGAIMLGIVTYDPKLLVIRKSDSPDRASR